MGQWTDARLMDAIRDHYPVVAAELLEPLLTFLTVARDLVGGDSDKVVVMLVISVRTKQSPDFVKLSNEQLDRGEIAILPSLGVNIRSIADSTGMPRETVRRKVAELVADGMLVRVGKDVRYTAAGYIAVAPARDAIEVLAMRNFKTVHALLGD